MCLAIFCCCGPSSSHIYTLSLHDALPISGSAAAGPLHGAPPPVRRAAAEPAALGRLGARRAQDAVEDGALGVPHRGEDRKSTRLNSSHSSISYAVFCLKKKSP